MTKADFIDKFKAVKGGPEMTNKQAGLLVSEFFCILEGAIVKDKRFYYPGFGTFHVVQRKARPGRNPRSNKVIQIPARKAVTFKAALGLKGKLK